MNALLVATLVWSVPPAAVDRAPPPCICVCPGAAAAVPAVPVPADEVRSPRLVYEASSVPDRWYGGGAVAGDVLSFTMIGGGAAANSVGALLFGVAGYGLGAPINHLVHGHSGRALASFGIRLLGAGVAAGAFLLDVEAHPCDGESFCRHTPALGLGVGVAAVLTAMILDDALLAREPVRAPRPGVALIPTVAVGANLAALSLGGSF